MNNIVTVNVPSSSYALTTLERVKAELGISTMQNDDLLEQKIDEASSDIESHTGRVFAREALTETFFGGDSCVDYLMLDRYPVSAITSITVDGVLVPEAHYRRDDKHGFIYHLTPSGFTHAWFWCRELVVVYEAGYILPGESGRNLPPALEAGAVELVKSFWLSRRRDSQVKSVDIPGVIAETYWVGSVGEDGELPPSVDEKISGFRRVAL